MDLIIGVSRTGTTDPPGPPLTRRTPRLYQRAFRRRNTQHSRIYDEFGLAPTVSTTSAVYVWHTKYASSPGFRACRTISYYPRGG